jgi:hypothetical protein
VLTPEGERSAEQFRKTAELPGEMG